MKDTFKSVSRAQNSWTAFTVLYKLSLPNLTTNVKQWGYSPGRWSSVGWSAAPRAERLQGGFPARAQTQAAGWIRGPGACGSQWINVSLPRAPHPLPLSHFHSLKAMKTMSSCEDLKKKIFFLKEMRLGTENSLVQLSAQILSNWMPSAR